MILIAFARENPVMAAAMAWIYLLKVWALAMWCVWVTRLYAPSKADQHCDGARKCIALFV